MTNLDTIYSCNKWELDAILEGLNHRELDQQEHLVELALNLRYTLNAKKVQISKLSKNKQRNEIKSMFNRNRNLSNKELLKRIESLNKTFANKFN